jgi:aspartate kinase
MRKRIVSKFGGSLLRNKKSFLEVSFYITNLIQKYNVVPVVSAPKGVTNTLIKLYETRNEEIILNLKSKYEEILKGISNLNIREEAFKLLNDELKRLEENITYDQFVSTGENHSGIILSHFLKNLGYNSIYIDGYKVGIIVDSKGVIKEDLSVKNVKENLEKYLNNDIIPIVGGFVGKELETGAYKLLGRNSTDVTGAIVAAAIRADYEIVKDVPGIYIVEPKYGRTKVISKLSYEEAGELTWRGIEAIHPLAIKIAKNHNIIIKVKNLKSETSTLICRETATNYRNPIAGISARKFYLLTINDELMNTPEGRGYLANVTEILSSNGVDVYDVATSANEISITISPKHMFISKMRVELILKENLEKKGYKPNVKGKNVGALSVTGEFLKHDTTVLERLITALNKNNIEILMIAKSLSSSNLIFIIKVGKLKKAVNTIYKEFFRMNLKN